MLWTCLCGYEYRVQSNIQDSKSTRRLYSTKINFETQMSRLQLKTSAVNFIADRQTSRHEKNRSCKAYFALYNLSVANVQTSSLDGYAKWLRSFNQKSQAPPGINLLLSNYAWMAKVILLKLLHMLRATYRLKIPHLLLLAEYDEARREMM